MKLALLFLLSVVSMCYASEPMEVAMFRNSLLVPTNTDANQTNFEKAELPFFYRGQISPSGQTIRVLGVRSESASETEAAIWEIPDCGGTWEKWRSVPPDARAVFVSDQTWGYVDRGHPRKIVLFDGDVKSSLTTPIPANLVVGDTVPLVWSANEKAVILAVAKAGVWDTDDQGISVNVGPPGEWSIAKVFMGSGKIAEITLGERPTLSSDQKILAFLRDGELRVKYLDTGRERVMYRPHLFDGAIRSLFWLPDSRNIIFNVSRGSELFGMDSHCAELDIRTGKIRDIWTADIGCSAAVQPSFTARTSVKSNPP